MRKLVFMFVAFAAMTIASCGGSKTGAAVIADSTAVDTIDTIEVVDSVIADSVVAE